jgi:hypothetical protein
VSAGWTSIGVPSAAPPEEPAPIQPMSAEGNTGHFTNGKESLALESLASPG